MLPAYVNIPVNLFSKAYMDNPQGKGLREWQASLTPEQRKTYARKGGKARAKALGPKRCREIAQKAARVRAAGIYARKQALSE